jgi:hypothetical protein
MSAVKWATSWSELVARARWLPRSGLLCVRVVLQALENHKPQERRSARSATRRDHRGPPFCGTDGPCCLPTVLPSVFVSRVVSISHYLLKPRNGHSTHTNLSEHHPHHHHLTPTQDWKEHNPVRSGSPRNMDANIDTRKGSKTSEHPSVWRFTEREKRR